ncbi:hypothetical protein R80B4_00787 [Fibrobacteres bacterium R8-0-B4]
MHKTDDEIMDERMKSLVLAWLDLRDKTVLKNRLLFDFNHALAAKAVKHYAADLNMLKKRYGIKDRAQPPKVAGLMANAILKYRLLVPKSGKQKDIEQTVVNEMLAIYHGLSICASYYGDGGEIAGSLLKTPHFAEWLHRFIYLLRERNYTSESLIMVFETFCLVFFPGKA